MLPLLAAPLYLLLLQDTTTLNPLDPLTAYTLKASHNLGLKPQGLGHDS